MTKNGPRIASIPASFFGIVLGVLGLAGAWRLASQAWQLSAWVGEILSLVGVMTWVVLAALYGYKWVRHRPEAWAEFRHPILCCFVGIIPVSGILAALALRPYAPVAGTAFVIAGVVAQLSFGVFRTGELWKGDRDPLATTPILYLPTVAGSFVSAIALSSVGLKDYAVPFFGAGLLSWLAIESVLIHRLYVGKELAVPLRPTLGIQLAPSAVGCYAYLSITTGPPDIVVQGLIGYALFQVLILIRLIPWIARQSFSVTYWAFTFGVSALASAVIRFQLRGGSGPLALAAPYLFAAANLIIGGIAVGTIVLVVRGRLMPPPIIAAAEA